jgi:hypothetical protein
MTLRPLPVVLLAIVTTLGVLALGVTGAPLVAPDPGVLPGESTVAPVAGGTVCITGADAIAPRADLLLLAAPETLLVAPDDPGGEPSGDASIASRAMILTLESDVGRQVAGPVAPGALEQVDVTPGAEGWLWVGWADHPLTAWQEWRTPGAPGEPRGAVASTCLPTDAPVQSMLGLRTDGGHEALVRLANPFEADATFAVTLVTAEGPIEPIVLRNVSVPGGERVTIRLNDHAPEQADLAAVVTVGAGRLAVEGLQRSVAAVGGIEGLSAVAPVTGSSTMWTFPWTVTGPDVEGAVWVLNPEVRPVSVTVTAHTPQGTAVPLIDRIEIGPGALVRLDTADLIPDAERVAGITLRSESTGILAAAGASFRSDDPSRSGLVRYAGSPAPDGEWSLAGLATPERETVLHIVNLSGEDADLRVTLRSLKRPATGALPSPDAPQDDGEQDDGEQAATDLRVAASDDQVLVELTPGRLAPGASTRVVLPLADARAFSVVVDGGSALVVSRTTTGQAFLEPVATAANSSRAWRSVERPLAGRPLAGWIASLRTDSGPGSEG